MQMKMETHYTIDKFHFNPFQGIKLLPHNFLSLKVIAKGSLWARHASSFLLCCAQTVDSLYLESWKSPKISIKQSDFKLNCVLSVSKNMFGGRQVQHVREAFSSSGVGECMGLQFIQKLHVNFAGGNFWHIPIQAHSTWNNTWKMHENQNQMNFYFLWQIIAKSIYLDDSNSMSAVCVKSI